MKSDKAFDYILLGGLTLVIGLMLFILLNVSDMKDSQARSQIAHYNSFLEIVKQNNDEFNTKLDARIAQRTIENNKFKDDMKIANKEANDQLLRIVEEIDTNVKNQLKPVADAAAETQVAVNTASTAAAKAAEAVKETPRSTSVQVITMSQVQAKQQDNYLKAVASHNREVDKYNAKFHTHVPHQKP